VSEFNILYGIGKGQGINAVFLLKQHSDSFFNSNNHFKNQWKGRELFRLPENQFIVFISDDLKNGIHNWS